MKLSTLVWRQPDEALRSEWAWPKLKVAAAVGQVEEHFARPASLHCNAKFFLKRMRPPTPLNLQGKRIYLFFRCGTSVLH